MLMHSDIVEGARTSERSAHSSAVADDVVRVLLLDKTLNIRAYIPTAVLQVTLFWGHGACEGKLPHVWEYSSCRMLGLRELNSCTPAHVASPGPHPFSTAFTCTSLLASTRNISSLQSTPYTFQFNTVEGQCCFYTCSLRRGGSAAPDRLQLQQ